MRAGPALFLLATCACAAAGCAARGTPPQHAGTGVASARACDANADAHGYREMTWDEYYAEINDRSWRRGVMVIWINPPQVRTVSAEMSQPSACR